MRRSFAVASGAAAILALSAGAAFARPAIVSTDLNVRAGQSTAYPVTAVMPAGAVVDVTGCGDGWCYVRGYGGYASARYLDIGAAAYRGGYGAYAYAPAPRFQFGISYSRGYPWWGW